MEELLIKYINNELNEEEWKKLRDWLEESPTNKTTFNKLLSYSSNSQEEANETEMILWDELKRRIEKDEQDLKIPKPAFFSYYWKVAATILFFATLSFFIYSKLHKPSTDVPTVAMVEKAASAGRKLTTQLPDGSLVWLNSGSKIQFSSSFTETSRDVFLEGEAFFEVAENPDRPFHVHTSNMTVTALGTAFNIEAFDGDVERVTLVEGKIGVSGFNNYYEEILPGNAVEMIGNNSEIRKIEVDPLEIISWKDGVLLFQGESYTYVLKKLERWYGVTIEVNGDISLPDQFFGKFKNASLENVLRSLSSGRTFDFEINGKQVIINNPQQQNYLPME